ncbi:MAG: hypothetical protein IKQ90_00515 [Ruminococcus sp.]|nr:hypothetical protein [Ruminococcus sp.]
MATKKKRFSILKFLIGLICIIFIAAAVYINVAFAENKTPKLLGRYIYIVQQRDTIGLSDVTEGAALVAKDAADVSIAPKDIVLCYPAGDPYTLRLCGISDIVTSEDGTERYQTFYEGRQDTADLITKDKIAAVCTGYTESAELGSFITFTRTIPGIVCELVIPLLILLIFLINGITSSKSTEEEEDDDFDFYEYDENEKAKDAGKKPSHAKQPNAPLVEHSQEIQPSDELERKKMSIAENFSQKKVNPDSPYQKEKERTMQFKAQREALARTGQISAAPTADALREEMLRKTAEAERTGTFSTRTTSSPQPAVIPDDTAVISASQVADIARGDSLQTPPVSTRKDVSKYEPKRASSSPDISDILGRSATNERKKHASSMSVDDLIKLIDEEKRKL